MRILTWNVNVLRTTLEFHPFSSLPNKSIEGLLGELHADIACFQEHKTRRSLLDKSMACPGPFDAFWTFPRSKTGYSGVCTYVDSRVCVPLKAEEGVTGLLLDDRASTMRPPWTAEERIGSYPDTDEVYFMDEVDGTPFDPRRLDVEGRAVVCDFGMFVLFNLYCPNETNDTRRPYKMNFLAALQARVRLLISEGREVIIAGDLNIMRSPLDSGEGGIKTSAEQHYEHPARRILDDWCAPKGPMIDVVRESWPDREGMFTCWNQKIDARPPNYGTRIDYILCSPGLRPWIKGGDIQPSIYGSDHCPVYIDLHDSIEDAEHGTIYIRDLLNPADRPPSTAPIYPSDKPRTAPEPPRFATKFLDEFSARQRTLKSLWSGSSTKIPAALRGSSTAVSPSPTGTPSGSASDDVDVTPGPESAPVNAHPLEVIEVPPLSVARAAFDTLDVPSTLSRQSAASSSTAVSSSGPTQSQPSTWSQPSAAPESKRPISTASIDLTEDSDEPTKKKKLPRLPPAKLVTAKDRAKGKSKTVPGSQQPKLASFWSAPQPTTPAPARAKEIMNPARTAADDGLSQQQGTSMSSASAATSVPSSLVHSLSLPQPSSLARASSSSPPRETVVDMVPDTEHDELLAQALAEADAERERERDAKRDEAAPVWSNLFAKKLPPMCSVHHKPCKDFIVKVQGPNKGKRFWLCSLPVGPGYDMGRSKRPREEVNPEYRCDFFLWDSANSRKEVPKTKAGMIG